jgi:hypothetical protein
MVPEISQDFLDRLISFLSRIPALEHMENRSLLLDGLPAGPINTIEREEALLPDLHIIVRTVAKWERVRTGEYALRVLFKNTEKFVEGLESQNRLRGFEEDFNQLVKADTASSTPVHRIPFTNRDDEIIAILSSFSPAYYLVDAPAGYGKTELLKKLEQCFREPERDWRCAYVAIGNNETLADLTIALAQKLGVSLVEAPGLSWGERLGGALQSQWERDPKNGLALLIDLEKKPALPVAKDLLDKFVPVIQESLYLLEFFRKNHNRFRVILAGRYVTTGTELRLTKLRLKSLHLAPFTYDVVWDSLSKYLNGYASEGLQQLTAHSLYLTGGHPGCVAQVLELYKDSRVTPDRFLESFGAKIWKEIVRLVVEEIQEEIPEAFEGFRETLNRLSIFRYLDYTILALALKENLIPGKNNEYDLATRLNATYLFSWQERLLKDDITRRLLATRMRYETPEMFVGLCQQARDICTVRLQDKQVQRPEVWIIEYLFQSLQQHANTIQEKDRRSLIRETFMNKDLPKAIQMFIEDREIPFDAKSREHKVLIQAMEKDWEFRFVVNYYLREDQYSNEPYIELQEKIEALLL